jgi:hypothetical protein
MLHAVSAHGNPQENNPSPKQQQPTVQHSATVAKPVGPAAARSTNGGLLARDSESQDQPVFVRGTGFRQQRTPRRFIPPVTPKPPLACSQLPSSNVPDTVHPSDPTSRNPHAQPSAHNPTKPSAGASTVAAAASAGNALTVKPGYTREPLILPRTPTPRTCIRYQMHAYSCHAPPAVPRTRPLVEQTMQQPGISPHVEIQAM